VAVAIVTAAARAADARSVAAEAATAAVTDKPDVANPWGAASGAAAAGGAQRPHFIPKA
jgi:hypothetical protein